jgi:hypothetical protein
MFSTDTDSIYDVTNVLLWTMYGAVGALLVVVLMGMAFPTRTMVALVRFVFMIALVALVATIIYSLGAMVFLYMSGVSS